jgi:PAS domain S-box-containing protein
MIQKLWGDENIYRTLLDNLPQNIFLKDGNSVYLSCNENYARALKIKAEEIVGKTDYEFYPTELAEKYRADDKRIMESGKAEEIEEKYIREGKEFTVQTVKTPIKDEQGNVIGILGIFWDITERKKAEGKLLDALAMREKITEGLDEGILLIDRNFKILWANRKQKEQYGEIAGEYCYLATHRTDIPCQSPHDICPIVETLKTGKPVTVTHTHFDRQGNEVFVEVTVCPVRDKTGEITQFVHVTRDITERKRIEEALREGEERYRIQFEQTIDALFLADTQTGIILECNMAATELIGREKSEMVGQHQRILHPSEEWDGKFSKSFKQHIIGETLVETKVIKKSGEIRDVAIRASTFDLKGKKVILAIFRDITESKRAEEALRESEERYKSLFKANIDGILIADATTKKLRYANPAICRMLGYSEEEFTRMSVADIHPKESLEQVFAEFEAQVSGAKINAELPCVRKDGQVISVSINASTVTIGQTEYMMGIFRDITESKQTEEKLKKLNEEMQNAVAKLEEVNGELKNFVYIASHDMREPLRKITAFGAILRQSLKDKLSSDDAENLHFMIDGAERMAKMIEGLLAYSRISTQAQPHQAVDLNEIVKQLQQFELSVLLEEKHATIEIPQPLPCVEADPVQIRQLMQNLIANGVKYQKKGNMPHITITTKPAADGMVRIEVTDNGIGIASEYQQSIFTMFRRLHSRDEYEGTGIGLAVCKKIVERHGGKISVESQPDKGSTFWFTTPMAQKTAAVAEEAELKVDELVNWRNERLGDAE